MMEIEWEEMMGQNIEPFISRHKPHYRLDSCGHSGGHQK